MEGGREEWVARVYRIGKHTSRIQVESTVNYLSDHFHVPEEAMEANMDCYSLLITRNRISDR